MLSKKKKRKFRIQAEQQSSHKGGAFTRLIFNVIVSVNTPFPLKMGDFLTRRPPDEYFFHLPSGPVPGGYRG